MSEWLPALLVNFGLSPAAPLTPRQFALLCPALLYQIDSRVCIGAPAPTPGDLLSGQWVRVGVKGWASWGVGLKPRKGVHWGPASPCSISLPTPPLRVSLWLHLTPARFCAALIHSTLAVLLLSLPHALSLLLLRLLGPRHCGPALGFLGAVAVGTLCCGDALLLLPHVREAPSLPPPQCPQCGTSSLPPPASAHSCLLVGSVGEGTPAPSALRRGCCRAQGGFWSLPLTTAPSGARRAARWAGGRPEEDPEPGTVGAQRSLPALHPGEGMC